MRVAEQYEPHEGDSEIFATTGVRSVAAHCQWPNDNPGEKRCEQMPLPARENQWLRFCSQHQTIIDENLAAHDRALPEVCPHVGTPHGECSLCALLAFLALTPDEQSIAGHSMRVSNTKGKQAAEAPRCARCSRQRTLSPCRQCATPAELAATWQTTSRKQAITVPVYPELVETVAPRRALFDDRYEPEDEDE